MRIANGIIASCILAITSAADQHEEMRCKARPGCHLAKCDPGLLSPSLYANEYPVTCVRTSVHDGEEYNGLKREMQVLQAAFALLNDKKMRMEGNDAALSKDIRSLTSRITTLENENKKTTSEMEALKIQLLKSDESNEALSRELNALRIKTNDLESRLAKPNTVITRSSCDGAQLESALALNDSGGVFQLDIPKVGITNVFCDVADDGGDWTVFQRRMNGDVDFYRNWADYVKGFGDLQGDHWIGLEALHQMTKVQNMEMKIKMITRKGIHWVAKYSNFSIGPASGRYILHVSGYSGNGTGDGLAFHNSKYFSTKDKGHHFGPTDCAKDYFEGGWWYWHCGAFSNLNGNFNKTGHKGFWWRWNFNLLQFSEMKFRKRL